jgi:N-acetylglutamate synthase-like GNAT family acetyltransferase
MIQVRPIHEAEAPQFLQLLCDVFELDYSRASGIFFQEPMFDLRRKWALFDDREMLSILTTVPLDFGWGPAIGIAGVATKVSRQREGLAGRLLDVVLEISAEQGEEAAWLFARETGLYAKHGFQVVDEVVRSPVTCEVDDRLTDMLTFEEIQETYNSWANQDPSRLKRDERRWRFWKWNLRVCTAFQGGYVCHEGKLIRELVAPSRRMPWRLPSDAEWVGLRSMAQGLDLNLRSPEPELHLMGRNAPGTPQMFMTDQF